MSDIKSLANQHSEVLRHLREAAREMDSVRDALAKQWRQFEGVGEAARQTLRQFDQAAEAARTIRQQTEALHATIAEPVRDALRAWRSIETALPSREWRDASASILAISERSDLSRMFKEMAAMNAAVAQALRPFGQQQQQMREFLETVRFDSAATDALANMAQSVALDHALHADGSVLDSLSRIVQAATTTKTDEPTAPDEPTGYTVPGIAPLDASLRQFQRWLEAQPPWVQLFTVLLLKVLLDIAVAQINDRWLSSDTPEDRRAIIYEVQQYNLQPAASSLRCVNAKGVNVRAAPSKEAEIIGRLPAGHTVEVVESSNGFSRVYYRSESSTDIHTGWAASGYLVKAVC